MAHTLQYNAARNEVGNFKPAQVGSFQSALTWRLDNGAKWRAIPVELGDWHHAYLRFRRWAVASVWDRIMAHVVANGGPKLAFACIDGPIVRAHQKAAGALPSKPLR